MFTGISLFLLLTLTWVPEVPAPSLAPVYILTKPGKKIFAGELSLNMPFASLELEIEVSSLQEKSSRALSTQWLMSAMRRDLSPYWAACSKQTRRNLQIFKSLYYASPVRTCIFFCDFHVHIIL